MFTMILVSMLVSIALSAAAYLLMPKPKTPKAASRDMEAPTAEAGRPIPVVFGNITVKSPNCLFYGDREIRVKKVEM